MVRSLADIFAERAALATGAGAGEDVSVACSYLEVYNEVRAGGGRPRAGAGARPRRAAAAGPAPRGRAPAWRSLRM
jgi:hypothetical protein